MNKKRRNKKRKSATFPPIFRRGESVVVCLPDQTTIPPSSRPQIYTKTADSQSSGSHSAWKLEHEAVGQYPEAHHHFQASLPNPSKGVARAMPPENNDHDHLLQGIHSRNRPCVRIGVARIAPSRADAMGGRDWRRVYSIRFDRYQGRVRRCRRCRMADRVLLLGKKKTSVQ